MRTALLLALIGVLPAPGQALIEDLEQRALATVNAVPPPLGWHELLESQNPTRTKFEQSLNLGRALPVPGAVGFLYIPAKPATLPAPAVVFVRPHVDTATSDARSFPAAIARTGVFALELDARAYHSKLDLLAEGILPQTVIQRDVRIALRYLRTRSDIHPTRIAIVGDGLAATLAGGLNPQFSAAVLLDGAPDSRALMAEFRSLKPGQMPDSCNLLPGIFRGGGTGQLLSLIAPRPLLLVNASESSLEFAASIYRSSGKLENLSRVDESGWTATARWAAHRWLRRWIGAGAEPGNTLEPGGPDPVRLELPAPAADEQPRIRTPISERSLSASLGAPLPEGPMTSALNCGPGQRVDFYPQAGIKVPVTARRPGPNDCGTPRGALVAVDDRGRASLANDEIIQEAVRRGWIVWMLDPRFVGELKTDSDGFIFAVSLLLGEDVTWRQAADIMRILHHPIGGKPRYPTSLYARGKNMTLAASYVAAITTQDALDWVVLRDAPASLRELKDAPPWVVPFNALRSFDIPDLWKAAGTKVMLIERPEDFLNQDW